MQWPIFVKLCMWVVVGISVTHMGILNTSFAHLFWLGNDKKGKYPEFCMVCSDKTWFVCGLSLQMGIFNTSFAYLFWLAYNKIRQTFRVLYGLQPTVTKLGMWVIVDLIITFVFCHCWMHMLKDLSQFQRKSAHAPQKELPKRKL